MEALPPAAAAARRDLRERSRRSRCARRASSRMPLPLISLQRAVGTAGRPLPLWPPCGRAIRRRARSGPSLTRTTCSTTFGPLLAPLEAEQASAVRSAVVAALNALQRAAGADGASARLPSASGEVYRVLCERLLSRMEPSRHCGIPFSLPVCSTWLRGAHQLAHRPNSALARLAAATDGAALFPQWQRAPPAMAARKQKGRTTYRSRSESVV